MVDVAGERAFVAATFIFVMTPVRAALPVSSNRK
jgi:hypothetical protein